MKLKKMIALLLCLSILAIGVFPAFACEEEENGNNTGSFTMKDVPKEHWGYEPVLWALENKVLCESEGGYVKPNDPVTRAEFAKMMVLSLKLKLAKPSKPTFTDVSKNASEYAYIETARPYLTGYKSGSSYKYYPARTAVREDMAVALVKALGFGNEAADESLLDKFSDKNTLSASLKKYMALAVKHNLMEGFTENGVWVVKPQGTLTRAMAASFLYKAFKQNEEKTTLEEEKVSLDGTEGDSQEQQKDEESGTPVPAVSAKVAGDKVVVSWKAISSSRLQGYKVVVSKYDSTPKYPDNGYFQWITDKGATSTELRAGDYYNGGDFGGKLKAGETYYFSVTAYYDDRKVAGNAIRLKMPANDED